MQRNFSQWAQQKYNLKKRRRDSINFDKRTDDLRATIGHNKVVIFPSDKIKAWDHMPRFKILEADLKNLQEEKVTNFNRRKKRVKSNFVGS